jgi:hypothetical protein
VRFLTTPVKTEPSSRVGDGLLLVLLFFEDLLAGDDDVAALLVELDDADFDLGADVAVEVTDGANFDLRTGQERLDADVDSQAALDARDDHTLDGGLGVGSLFELVPHLMTQGLLVRDEIAAFLLFTLNDDFDDVADSKLGRAVVVENLIQRDETFGLETDVDHRVLIGDLDDGTGDDSLFSGHSLGSVFFGSLFAIETFERLGKVFGIVLGLGSGDIVVGSSDSDVALLNCGLNGSLFGGRRSLGRGGAGVRRKVS